MMRIHFLNVGKGDCTIIEHDTGHVSMVDINNSQLLDDGTLCALAKAWPELPDLGPYMDRIRGRLDAFIKKAYDIELSDPVAYYKSFIGASRPIFRFIATHPDMDHLSGLARLAHEELAGQMAGILNFWDTRHSFDKTDFENSPYDERDWDRYQELRKGQDATILHLQRGSAGQFYNRDFSGEPPGDGITILAPTEDLEYLASLSGDPNDLSYVLNVAHGAAEVVLGGDATADGTWHDVEAWLCEGGLALRCDILKASHHGRRSGYHGDMVRMMQPAYVIVSTGEKDEHDASGLYRDAGSDVLSTRWWGNIIAECEPTGEVRIYTEKDRRHSPHLPHPVYGYWPLPPRTSEKLRISIPGALGVP
jgi:competence protein ComEC